MFFRYNIYISGKYMLTVTALSEASAKDKAYNAFGSASRYSGVGYNNIEVERV